MHGGQLSEDEPMADMNLIPLIDIALTLLIIMMVTTTFIKQPGVSLKLPETATHEGAQETPKDLTIAVTQQGALYMDGREQPKEQVQAALQDLSRKNHALPDTQKDREGRVMIKGDKDVTYARIMDVMDMARQAGLTKVVLPTDPKSLLGSPAAR